MHSQSSSNAKTEVKLPTSVGQWWRTTSLNDQIIKQNSQPLLPAIGKKNLLAQNKPKHKVGRAENKDEKNKSQQISIATKDSLQRAKKMNSLDLNCPQGARLWLRSLLGSGKGNHGASCWKTSKISKR